MYLIYCHILHKWQVCTCKSMSTMSKTLVSSFLLITCNISITMFPHCTFLNLLSLPYHLAFRAREKSLHTCYELIWLLIISCMCCSLVRTRGILNCDADLFLVIVSLNLIKLPLFTCKSKIEIVYNFIKLFSVR